MAPSEPRPSEKPRGSPPPLDAFLEQAVPILAAERGVNAACRVKLAALAKDLGLAEEQFEEALRRLQSRAPAGWRTPRQQRRLGSLQRWLRKEFGRLPHGILSAAQEARLIEFATQRLRLIEQDVREVVRQVALELGVRRASAVDAHRYVEQLVERKVGDATAVDQETIRNLLSAARGWGLDDELAKGLIADRLRENRRLRAREQAISLLAAGAAAVAFAALFALLAWVLWGGAAARTSPRKTASPTTLGPKPTAGSSTATQPGWWDTDLVLAMAAGRVRWASFEPVYQRLRSDRASVRASAYEQLPAILDGQGGAAKGREDWDLLREIAVGCLVLEPDEGAAERLREAVLRRAAFANRPLPESELDYVRAAWAVQTAVDALDRLRSASARREALAAELGETLGVVVDSGLTVGRLERRCRQALAERCYQQLIESAARRPDAVRRLRDAIPASLTDSLSMADIERLDTQLLAALLPAVGPNWRSCIPLIKQCVASKDLNNVRQVLGLYERSRDKALQGYLASLLMLRTGAAPKSTDPEDVARAIRRALGGGASSAAADRWADLASAARRALEAEPHDRHSAIENTKALAYYGVLAAALAQKEQGRAAYERLRREGPPRSTRAAASSTEPLRSSPRSRGPSAVLTKSQQEALARYSRCLINYRRYSPSERLKYLELLAMLARRGGQADPHQAAGIAGYLAAREADQKERRQMLEFVPDVARWRYVRLAMADRLSDPSLTAEAARPLLLAMLPHAGGLERGEDWREGWRRRLIEDVLEELDQLEASNEEMEEAVDYDQAGQMLEESYRELGELLGVSTAEGEGTGSAAESLRRCVVRVASLLEGADLRPADRRLVTELPHRLRAIDYLARSDVERTALLQQLWIPLLAVEVARRRPDQASRAVELAESFGGRQAGAADVFAQLRDAEAASLELWLLCGPRGG